MKPKHKKPKRSWKMWALVFPCGTWVRVADSKAEARGPWADIYMKSVGMKIIKVTVTEGWEK